MKNNIRENIDIEKDYLVDVLRHIVSLFNIEHKTNYEFNSRVYEEIINILYKADKYNVPCSVDFNTEKHLNGSTFIRVKTILDYGVQYEVSGPFDRSVYDDRRN
jgi:hypothetical protein